MLRRSTTAAACAVTLLTIGATPATALTQPVDIAVLIASSSAPDASVKTFLAEGVTVGQGPELTADDLVPESDDLCGAVEVDIDPDDQTVTVTAVEDEIGCEISGLLSLAVLSDEVASFSVESDDLVTFTPDGENVRELDDTPGTVAAAWIAGEEQVLTLSGSVVFAYRLAATPTPTPTPTTPTPAPTPSPTPAPSAPAPAAPAKTPAKAAPAKPVVAKPTFTG